MTEILPKEKIERIEELAAENIENVRAVVNEKLDTATQTIAEAAEELRESTELTLERRDGLLEKGKSFVSEKKHLLAAKTRHVADLTTNSCNQLREGTGELSAKAKLFTRKNPIKSTALAMGLGIVTGLALRQARS